MKVQHQITTDPIKLTSGERTITVPELEQHADQAKQVMERVSLDQPGTCVDERARKCLISGEKTQPRGSVPGGPTVYANYIAELIGFFSADSGDDEDRLRSVKGILDQEGIKSGGHVGCAANAGFNAVLGIVHDNQDALRVYARQNIGDQYQDDLMDQVFFFAEQAHSGGVYQDHQEDTLKVLGDEAPVCIEELIGEHEGRTLIRNYVGSYTVDQTKLHDATGEDSFVNDDWYASDIEQAVAKRSDNPEQAAVLARHAREAILAAVAQAVPNNELHQIVLR